MANESGALKVESGRSNILVTNMENQVVYEKVTIYISFLFAWFGIWNP